MRAGRRGFWTTICWEIRTSRSGIRSTIWFARAVRWRWRRTCCGIWTRWSGLSGSARPRGERAGDGRRLETCGSPGMGDARKKGEVKVECVELSDIRGGDRRRRYCSRDFRGWSIEAMTRRAWWFETDRMRRKWSRPRAGCACWRRRRTTETRWWAIAAWGTRAGRRTASPTRSTRIRTSATT